MTLGALTAAATFIFKVGQFLGNLLQKMNGGKPVPAWVPQFLVALVGVAGALLFRWNGLALVSKTLGGSVANIPAWLAEVLTGIGLAAIADGAVSTGKATLAAFAKQPPQTPPANGLW